MRLKVFPLIVVCLLISSGVLAETINMHVLIYPPLAYEVDGDLKGIVPDMVREIQTLVGDTNTIQKAPWLRAYKQAQTDPAQALFAIVRMPSREKLFKWVGPIFGEGDYFFRRKGSGVTVDSLADARSVRRIAVRKKGYTHQALLEKGFTNLDVSPSYTSSYRKLADGRVDLVLMGEFTYYYMIKKAGLDPAFFERTNYRFNDSSAWLAFSCDIPDATIEKWQKALDVLKASGRYEEIMRENFNR